MKRRDCLYLAMLVLCVLGCSESKETRMQRFLILGNEKIRQQEYEQAEKFFNSALGLDSCFADAWNNLGTVEQRRQNLQKSAMYYSRALACNDTFYLARLNRANVYFEMNDTLNASNDIAILIRRYPDSLRVEELSALLLWKMHKQSAAISVFRSTLRRDANSRNALINLGTLYTSLKRPDSASFFLDHALGRYPQDADLFNAMAMLKASAAKFEEADEWIDKALTLRPDDAYFLNNKGYILLLKGETDAALKLINASIVEDPYNAWAYRNKGIIYYNTGNYEEAWRLLSQAGKMDPYVDDLYAWLGRCRLKMAKPDACVYIQEALAQGQWDQQEIPSICR